ncbi:hypothetical protein GZH47_06590 [Paenibacillus rhizovicinus]|uniref:Lipoprotein n=1 Tax=Paenibacillus rhizovicinus TaxID=2704463 RepID=A0A6C0P1F0_9BACL|nr:hypothetical protein [Paenibacillus rhizovicinus]QHW30552.1 hypothetical protein GZH47_06590 [Paenibacillus rhizovicinus]
MNRKRNWIAPCAVIVVLAGLLAACSGGNEAATTNGGNMQENHDAAGTVETPVIAAADEDPAPAPTEKEDDSVRALFKLPSGQLSVKPVTKAVVQAFDAPSCYGAQNDLKWQGEYEAVWEPDKGDTVRIGTFPADFEIVQQTDKPITMQHFRFGDTDLLVYVPRYTDCHALETYFFGVQDGEAFPVPMVMSDKETWPNIGQLPGHLLQVKNGEMIVTGGYAAGQDTIPVYYFRYDAANRVLVLTKTEQAQVNAIIQ